MDLIGKLNGIAELTEKMALAIREQNWGQALELSGEEWLLRKQLWPNIETDETKEIDQIARENGALFSRVCGAGGGGVMAIFVHPDQRQNVIEALNHSRGTVMNAVISNEGLRVSTYQ